MCHYSYYEVRAGPIKGLYLPFATWAVLQRERITTIDQLRAVADEVHLLPGIGSKTAQLIRDELARVGTSSDPASGAG